jgi:excisionase family DNA binding protein
MNEFHRGLMNRKQSAQYLGVSLRTLDSLQAAKLLPAKRIGRRVLFNQQDLEKFASRSHPDFNSRKGSE